METEEITTALVNSMLFVLIQLHQYNVLF